MNCYIDNTQVVLLDATIDNNTVGSSPSVVIPNQPTQTILLFTTTVDSSIANASLTAISNTFYGTLYYSAGNVADGLDLSKTICRDTGSRFRLNDPGLYKIKFKLIMQNNGSGFRFIQLRNQAGTILCAETVQDSTATSNLTLELGCIYLVTSSDTEWVQAEIYQQSGSAQTIYAGLGYACAMKIN